ncbi:MAG TPA: hypothetical protein PKN50_01335, partial [Spirochaetota bacterium]|nr:hypothetical protein [Spirochaetota bacterium]
MKIDVNRAAEHLAGAIKFKTVSHQDQGKIDRKAFIGLHAYLKDRDIKDLLGGADIADSPKDLIALANTGGGHDNITAVVVRVESSDPGQST